MKEKPFREVIFLGLPGPTHHYGGLAAGNVASAVNAGAVSYPREAALQTLTLAERLKKLGADVAFLPPHPRPWWPLLNEAGFTGSHDEILEAAAKKHPQTLSQSYSSAFMWAANAATIAPAPDTADKKLHVTPANLVTNRHRKIEADHTYSLLKALLAPLGANVHPPLPARPESGDEGAANHMRLAPEHGVSGLHVFVYGKAARGAAPKKYPARQTKIASESLAKQHQLLPSHCVFVQQHPDTIDKGVFHNDVIAVSHLNLLLAHESAFLNGEDDHERITEAYYGLFGTSLQTVIVKEAELSVEDAVSTYFFNSQILSLADGKMALITPEEVKKNAKAKALVDAIIKDKKNPISEVHYLDLRQSMQNGGGPACLRLRVVMEESKVKKISSLADAKNIAAMKAVIAKHYPETLDAKMLADVKFADDAMSTVRALQQLLHITF